MIRRGVLSVVAMIVLCLGCAASPAQAGSAGEVHETKSFSQATQSKRIALDVCPDARSVSLRISIEARRGSISWRLMDPAGVIRDNGTVDGTRGVYETKNLSPDSGLWTLEISTQEASGSYDVRWRVR